VSKRLRVWPVVALCYVLLMGLDQPSYSADASDDPDRQTSVVAGERGVAKSSNPIRVENGPGAGERVSRQAPETVLGGRRARSLRSRVGARLRAWGYRRPEGGFRRVVPSRLRGLALRRRLDSCGGRLEVGPGMSLFRSNRDVHVAVGEHVQLWAGVRIRLWQPGAAVEIGDGTLLERRTEIDAHRSVSIGSDCLISWDVLIMDSDFHRVEPQTEKSAPIRIGDHVWIGARVTILKGVTVGDGAVIGAGSVVTSDVPPAAVVAGVPARIVRRNAAWEV
jgi:acetyltransferase-like isoleucine patch superfamily enzyme